MTKRNKYHKIEANEFYDYFEGKLSDKDRNAFERQLEKDLFDADAAEGLSMLNRKEAEQDLAAISRRINHKNNRNRRIGWYSAAAAIASILIVTTVFVNVADSDKDKFNSAPEMKEATKEQPAPTEKKVASREFIEEQVPSDKADDKEESVFNETETSKIEAEPSLNENIEDSDILKEVPVNDEESTFDFVIEDDVEITHDDIAVEATDEINIEEISDNDAYSEKEEIAAPVVSNNEATSQTVFKDEKAAPSAPGEGEVRSKKISFQSKKAEEELKGKVAGTEVNQKYSERITGVVRSAEDLQPLPGVSIVIRGTNLGTVTDFDGVFSLDLPTGNEETLVASYIGMETEEFIARADQPAEIAMLPSSTELNEVVVMANGYSNRTNEEAGNVSEVIISDPAAPSFTSPAPENGILAYRRYIDSTLVYPPNFEEDAEKAVVVLKFSISPNGRPTEFTVIKTPSPLFSDEAIRAITTGPDWIPGTRNGTYFDELVRLRVVFKNK